MLLKAVTISCILALACGAPGNKGSRIIGGQNAEPGQFEHQAAYLGLLYGTWEHFCGGSIISSKSVLTSANCYLDFIPMSDTKVVVGSTIIGSGGVEYKIKSFIKHENWDFDTMENDIAVIIIEGEIEFNDLVAPIKLASYSIDTDTSAVITGWDFTSLGENGPKDPLQSLETKTISNKQCQEMLGRYFFIFSSEFCTLNPEGEGSCYGDNGGPLIKDGELHGISSQFIGCANALPAVFTRVYSFVNWIEAHAQ